jgi:hypothetical protein
LYIAEPLSHLINKSFLTGSFPDCLKIAKVCPIFKSGDKHLFSNYRPISILPSFSKIYEKVVACRLLKFFESGNILVQNQYGFRKNHSTYMAAIEMLDKISAAIDNGEHPIGIFIDLSKAFDTINHSILLDKLEYYGIRGFALRWFESYLQSRQQYVFFDGASSVLCHVNCGVPQGSILGPLLFILYINDIVKCSDILRLILFADDTNIFYSNSDIIELERIVNAELSKLSNWFMANRLSLNATKTNFIIFGNKKVSKCGREFKLVLNGNVLERTDCTKFLGVYFDEKLKWHIHLNHVSGKLAKGLGMLGRVGRILPFNVLRTLYHTLIYPYLNYCCIIWGGAGASILRKIEVLQNRAIRIITHSPFRASSSPIYKSLNLLKICDIHFLHIVIFMFKFKHCLLPAPCMYYCKLNSTSYGLRKINYFCIPPCRTKIREQSISVVGPRLWGSLPDYLQDSDSLMTLKRNTSKYLLSLY